MFPSKSMFDYKSEIYRLFPESGENDLPNLPTLFGQHPNLQSPSPQQPMAGNQSSSSADSSLSPEYPDTASRLHTPFSGRLRPIVGRKIISNNSQNSQMECPSQPISSSFDSGFDSSPVRPKWYPEETHMTPNNRHRLEQNNFEQYELFPERNREFKTALNTPPSFYSMSANVNFSPPSPKYTQPPNRQLSYPLPNFTIKSPQTHFPSSSMQANGTSMCTFCRKNGETPVVYMTHTVRTHVGNKSIVTCPILRSHVCSTCGESGDNAHTITYCPVLRSNNHGRPLQSTTITLKNTRVKSNGRRRF